MTSGIALARFSSKNWRILLDLPMAPDTRPLPSHIGRFRVEELLGSGGMGDVYRAIDPTLQRMVAVKTVRPNIEKPEYLTRLYREAQACARLQHPHIVTVHEAGEVDGVVYIAMEYLKGRDLAKVLKQGSLSFEDRIRILNEVLEALEHAHGENVIHRDIKPSNVYVLPNGAIKLVDFGLARMEHAEALTVVGTTLGTPHYASPEQLAGDATVDLRTDVYSVGVLAYELFTGRRPFARGEDDSLAKLIMRVLSEPPPPMNVVWTRRYPDLERIVMRAMAKEPADRYQSASAMRAALTALLSTAPLDVADSAPVDSETVLIDPSVDAETRVATSGAQTTMRATTPMVATTLGSAASTPTTLHAPNAANAATVPPQTVARDGMLRAWPWMAGIAAMVLVGVLVNSTMNNGGGATASPAVTSPPDAAAATTSASTPVAPASGPSAPAATSAGGTASNIASTTPATPPASPVTNALAAPMATPLAAPTDGAVHALSAVQMFDRPATVAGGSTGLRYRVPQALLQLVGRRSLQ